MKVREAMSKRKRLMACGPNTTLAAAAAIMWTGDCGALPVVDEGGRVMGMITDRDIAIALGTSGTVASEVLAGEVMSREVFASTDEDDIGDALRLMRRARVRRLPVLDDKGIIQGVLSINDLVRCAGKNNRKKNSAPTYKEVLKTLKAISEPGISAPAREEPAGEEAI